MSLLILILLNIATAPPRLDVLPYIAFNGSISTVTIRTGGNPISNSWKVNTPRPIPILGPIYPSIYVSIIGNDNSRLHIKLLYRGLKLYTAGSCSYYIVYMTLYLVELNLKMLLQSFKHQTIVGIVTKAVVYK